jgi:hypothetical protein
MAEWSARLRCALGILALLGVGCGGGYRPPSSDAARTALERSLNAWKEGARPGPVEGADPPVQVSDVTWQAGRKLDSFEILSEESDGDEKRFAVRLSLTGDPAPKETLYFVFGTSPIFVYAEEDYRRMVNMDNNPGTGKPFKGPRR